MSVVELLGASEKHSPAKRLLSGRTEQLFSHQRIATHFVQTQTKFASERHFPISQPAAEVD